MDRRDASHSVLALVIGQSCSPVPLPVRPIPRRVPSQTPPHPVTHAVDLIGRLVFDLLLGGFSLHSQ